MENKIRRSPKLLFYILYLIFSVALFTACTREDDLQTIMEEYDPENAYGDYSETYWRRVHAQQRQAYIGDLYRSYGVAMAITAPESTATTTRCATVSSTCRISRSTMQSTALPLSLTTSRRHPTIMSIVARMP